MRAVRFSDAASQRLGVGAEVLRQRVVAVEAKVGKGRAILFGPEILQRAQPHGTFKLFFNALYLSAASQ